LERAIGKTTEERDLLTGGDRFNRRSDGKKRFQQEITEITED
jgi:hypothetical protein